MKVHIIGAGPVGLLLASLLQESGHLPLLITKNAGDTQQRRFTKVSPTGGLTQVLVELTDWSQVAPKSIDFAVICTKAGEALAAFDQLVPTLTGDGKVVFLNNGMGPQQTAFTLLPDAVFWGSNTHGAFINDKEQLVHAGYGNIVIGQMGRETSDQLLPSCFTWNQDINRVLWQKLAVNAVINPLTAKFRCRNGELLTHPEARALMELLGQELDNLAQAANIPDLQAESVARNVAQQTAQNWSSTLQDLMRGRPNELPHITGYVVALAEALNVACPTHKRLFLEVVGNTD